MTTKNKQSNKKTTKEMKARVNASFKDEVKKLEREKLKDVKKSDVVNSANTISDTIDSLDNCGESIKQLDASITGAVDTGKSIQKQIEEICFDSKGQIDDFGVDSIVDYATRLKNQTEGQREHINFKKLEVLRKQFARAFDWAESNDFIKKSEKMSLIGTGKKMTQSPDTDNPFKELSKAEQTDLDKAEADAKKSQEEKIKNDREDWFISLTDKEFDRLCKERNEFKLMTNDKAKKKTIIK